MGNIGAQPIKAIAASQQQTYTVDDIEKMLDTGMVTRQSIIDGLINAAAENEAVKLFLMAHIEYHTYKTQLISTGQVQALATR